MVANQASPFERARPCAAWSGIILIWILVAAADVARPSVLSAQVSSTPEAPAITLGERWSLESEALGVTRSVWVSLPPEYEQSSDSLTVLYLLDAETHFLHVVGIVRFLAAAHRAPPLIVVGIPNPSWEARSHDLTPLITDASFAERFPSGGGAVEILRFLSDELKSWMSDHYRVTGRGILAGHSFGGLAALDAMVNHPGGFDGYAVVSPSLWWDNGAFARQLAAGIGNDALAPFALYLAMANEADDAMAGARAVVDALSGLRDDSTIRWTWRHMTSEDHGSVMHRAMYEALEWLFQAATP